MNEMEPRYFVTMPIPSNAVHIAASTLSKPVIIAGTHNIALHEGRYELLARGIASNLVRGMLVTYEAEGDRKLRVSRDHYEEGRKTNVSTILILDGANPIESLESTFGKERHSDNRLDVFGRFSEAEIAYLESFTAKKTTAAGTGS